VTSGKASHGKSNQRQEEIAEEKPVSYISSSVSMKKIKEEELSLTLKLAG
jgi:hypothetical protein